MNIKELFTDDDAVSPVIGVILMVAITVILAAVIAAFVLGLGDTSNPGPSVSFDYDYNEDDNVVAVTVQSGDQFDADAVTFTGDVASPSGGASADVTNSGEDWTEKSGIVASSLVGAGDSIDVGVDGTGYEIDLVWESDDGSDSQIISSNSGPDA